MVLFAILFQNIFAYVVTLCVYQIGLVVTGAGSFGIGTIVALILAASCSSFCSDQIRTRTRTMLQRDLYRQQSN